MYVGTLGMQLPMLFNTTKTPHTYYTPAHAYSIQHTLFYSKAMPFRPGAPQQQQQQQQRGKQKEPHSGPMTRLRR